MKILLDENIDIKIQFEFGQRYEVYSARQMEWNGKKNGELLSLCVNNNFDVLITLDKNLQHQQNLDKFNIHVILLRVKNNRFYTIKNLMPKILEMIEKGLEKQLTVIE